MLKITLEDDHRLVEVTIKQGDNDLTLKDVFDAFKGATVALGYMEGSWPSVLESALDDI